MPENNTERTFDCICYDPTHRVRFDIVEGVSGYDDTLLVELTLNSYQPWYKRIWIGIKYIIGISFRSSNDFYHASELSVEDSVKLRNICDTIISNHADHKWRQNFNESPETFPQTLS